MKKSKKLPIIIVLIIAVTYSVFSFIYKYKKSDSTAEYKTGMASIMNLETSFSAKGNIKGVRESKVYRDSYYPVDNILVSIGDTVKKGQRLAEFDISDLKKQYELAKTEEEYYRKKYELAEKAYATKTIALMELNDAEYLYHSAVQKSAMYDIEKERWITSPIDGVITAVNCSIGGIVSVSATKLPAFVIEDMSSVIFKARIKEKDIPFVYDNQPVRIYMNTVGSAVIYGTVTDISSVVSLDADTGKNIVEASITLNEDFPFSITGIAGKAEFSYEKSNVLAVPTGAVKENLNEKNVYKYLNDGSIAIVPVTTGISNDEFIEITSGELTSGDYVIINPESIRIE